MRTIAVIANVKFANLFRFFGIDLSFSIPEDGEIKEICENLIAENVGIIFTTEELESKVKETIKDQDVIILSIPKLDNEIPALTMEDIVDGGVERE